MSLNNSLVSLKRSSNELRKGVCKSDRGSITLLRVCDLLRFLVLAEIPLTDENRKERDRAYVEHDPSDLDTKVHADLRSNGQHRKI